MIRTFILLLCLFPASYLYSQPVPMFHHYTTADGLPSSQTYQVLQDKKGYIWIASDHGLIRYNGYEFRTFTTADGLKDNVVFKIQEDHKGRIWMQTFSGRLFYIENDSIQEYRFNNVILDISSANIPLAFYIDSSENVYFICTWKGEYKIDAHGRLTSVFAAFSDENCNRVFFNKVGDDRLISSGNFAIDPGQKTCLYYSLEGSRFDSVMVPDKYAGHIYAAYSKGGEVLVSISRFLYRLKDHKLELLKEFSSIITNIYFDRDSYLWISTYSGIHMLDAHYNAVQYYLSQNFISSVTEDSEHGKWITTVNNGVYYLAGTKVKSFYFENDLNEPLCLSEDGKNIYAGFWSGQLVKFSNTSYDVIYTAGKDENISSIYADHESGKIYMSKSVPGYVRNGKYKDLLQIQVHSVKGSYLKRKNGQLLNASVKHLLQISNDTISVFTTSMQRMNCIGEAPDGKLIIGTNDGPYQILVEDSAIARVEPGLNGVRIDDIAFIKDKIIYATRGKGLQIRFGDKLYSITSREGLISDLLHRMVVSGNTLFCASNNGVSRIILQDGNELKYDISNISYPDGLPGNEINDIILLNDTVWVAAKNSVSFFPANADFFNPVPPPVYITYLKINNKQLPYRSSFTFSYSVKSFSIGFESLSYQSGGRMEYRYILANEKDSIESVTLNRQVEFLSLKPGEYTFTIYAKSHSGTWSRQPAVLRFVVTSPFWQKKWFVFLCSVLFAGMVIFYSRMRIARIRREEELKTAFNRQLAELEMKALRAQMNPHFIFNVMNSIQDYILKNETKSAQRYLSKFARLVRVILDNSMVGEIVLSEELKAVELYIDLEQQRFDKPFDFTLTVHENVDRESLVIPSMILQPYVENAIKHGISHLDEKGNIIIRVMKKKEHLEIIIEDNGVGRKAASEFNRRNVRDHVSYGSVITEDRIKAYNVANNTDIKTAIADLVSADGQPCGTRVILTLPVKYRN